MSYEGYVEYICKAGHYFVVDAYLDTSNKCPECGFEIEYRHSVDETNGIEIENPDTYPAPTKVIRTEDVRLQDKYGNIYYEEEFLYAPDSPAWRRILS